MAEVIRMPLMSDTMEEGTIVEWHKKEGDKIEPGELMAEVETDKATMELESYLEGTLLYIGVKKGETVPVNGVIAVVGEEGEDYKEILEKESASAGGASADKSSSAESKKEEKPSAEAKADKKEPAATETKAAPQPQPAQKAPSTNGRIKASPLAKRMAEEAGVDIANIEGSGDEGRIIKRDVENFIEAGGSRKEAQPAIQLPSIAGKEDYEEVPVTQMRKTIARRLAESKFSAPHFYLTMEADMEHAMAARKRMNEVAPVKISFNDIIIKAVAAALQRHPKVNASWLGDRVRYNKHIHIGMAVAVEDGLVVPVIKFAAAKSLAHINQEAKQFAEKARNKKLQPEDYEGNTFTISNLGMFDIDEFTAIINPPDACILAVGKIKEKPVVKNGEIKIGHTMKITLSCDHRVVDGATGSQFLQTLKEFLEDPVRLLI